MAFSPKLISFFFLFTLLFAQIFARESQFFSKVSGTTTTATAPTNVNNPATTTVNGKETTIPNKEEENFNFKNQEQEQEPSFMRETQNGYGLYGQELNDQESNTQFPTTTKLGNAQYTTGTTTTTSAATYTPYKTPTREPYTYYPNTNGNANYYSNNQYNTNGFEDQQQQQHNFGETSLQERSFTPLSNQNNYYRNNGGVGFNQEGRQGMSDTRFLENGKYFHDINNENKIPTNNYYNTPAGYYNNNNNNNENTYKYSMENQQEDFQEREDEQYVP